MICTKCPLFRNSRTNNLNSSGPKNARLMIIGESSGEEEDKTGKPFVGSAGKKLDELLEKVGIDRNNCFIVNVIGCKPTDDKTPQQLIEWADCCRDNFLSKIDGCNPEIILTLGNAARYMVTGKTEGIQKEHGIQESWNQFPNATVISTVHPAAVLRSSGLMVTAVQDFNLVSFMLNGENKYEKPTHYRMVSPGSDLISLREELEHAGRFSFDIETTGFNWMNDRILCIGFSTEPYTGYVLPILGQYGDEIWSSSDYSLITDWLIETFREDMIQCGANLKFDLRFLRQIGVKSGGFLFDVCLVHHLIDEEAPHSLDYISATYTDMAPYKDDFHKLKGKKDGFDVVDPMELWKYLAKDVDATIRSTIALESEAGREEVLDFYIEFTEPLIHAMLEMELRGILIDVPYLENQVKNIKLRNFELASKIRKEIRNPELNLNSSIQISDLLFNKLKLTPIKKTKGGKNSVDEDVMKKLAENSKTVADILYHREQEKLVSLMEGLEKFTDNNNRVHPTANIGRTDTGRVAYKDPPVQGVPDTKEMRKVITAPEGFSIIACDYSQADLWGLAFYSGDDAMMDALTKGMHDEVARFLFNIPEDEEVGAEERRKAKGVNFGVCVPISTVALTRNGWKGPDEISIGDEVLGYNVDTKKNEWTIVRDVFRLDNADMVRFGHKHYRFTCTPDHRWVDEHRKGKYIGGGRKNRKYEKIYETELRRTKDLTDDSNLILSAISEGGDSSITEDEASIIGWLYTDGGIYWSKWANVSANIFQKHGKYTSKIIEDLLTRENCLVSKINRKGIDWFHIKSGYIKGILDKSKIHELGLERFVLSLKPGPRRAFLNSGMLAEGHIKRNVFTQNTGEVLDAFRLAGFLEGYFVTQTYNGTDKFPKSRKLKFGKPRVTAQNIEMENLGRMPAWCIKTDLNTWVAREDDSIFITGNCYGITEFGLSKFIDVSKEEARKYIDEYFRKFHKMKAWIEETERFILTHRYSINCYGRKRHLDLPDGSFGLSKSQVMTIRRVLRQGVNAVIQSTVSDTTHYALIRIIKRFKDEDIEAYPLFTHHDCILFEANNDTVDRARDIIVEEMERPIKELNNARFIADPVVGPCWVGKG